jgi:hypothetical protein
MRELALHLLDIAENSAAARATTIRIEVIEDLVNDRLSMKIIDNGKGMDEEMVKTVTDPFVTSRTTRKVGLGIPLLKEAAEACDGTLVINSKVGVGTTIIVDFKRSHIDRMPLGDLSTTFLNLMIAHPKIQFIFDYKAGTEEFYLDDKTIKDELEGVPLTEPVILNFLRTLFETGVAGIQPAA